MCYLAVCLRRRCRLGKQRSSAQRLNTIKSKKDVNVSLLKLVFVHADSRKKRRKVVLPGPLETHRSGRGAQKLTASGNGSGTQIVPTDHKLIERNGIK